MDVSKPAQRGLVRLSEVIRHIVPQPVRSFIRRLWPRRYQALEGMDRRLLKHIPQRGGFFVELGANDGVSQSNTYYFERYRGWRGILIEPVPELYEQCRKNRPNSRAFNCACVNSDYTADRIDLLCDNLKSAVKGAREGLCSPGGTNSVDAHSVGHNTVSVPTATLSQLLDTCGSPEVDILSLDVEGYELQVLKGLDMERHRPKFMLIELNHREEVEAYLCKWYDRIEDFTWRDGLFKRKD
jgi:FkbM family methyltransferase